MARTTAEADEMITAAEAHGVVLVPFQNTRFMARSSQRTKPLPPKVGEVTGVRARFGHGGPQAWAPKATLFFDKDLAGGGCLIDLGCT